MVTARIRSQTVSSDTTTAIVVEAFESFYGREYRKVVALAYALSGSRSGAEDLAQEAFIAAHQRWDRIGAYEKPEAWVRRVVANMAISAFRRRTAERKAVERLAGQTPLELPELEPEDERFWQLVRELPTRQTQAITLHYLEDRSVAEISEILGCSQNTAKVHLFRGRQSLAARLGLEAPNEP